MKILKRILVIILLVAMVILLTGCNDEKNTNKNLSSKTSSTLDYLNNKTNNSSKGENTFMKNVKDLSSEEALAKAENQMKEPNKGDEIAIFHIKGYGDITVKFFKDVAPKAVENFITHAKEGYYNGVIFHRVIEEFMIQGGDPQGTGYGGESIWGEGFEEELSVDALPYRGALCMASSGTGTKSLGSQFYIVQANYREEIEAYLDSYGLGNFKEAYKKYGGDLVDLVGYAQYTTFGQVISGMDIVDQIAKVETDENDKPLENVVIESIDITTY